MVRCAGLETPRPRPIATLAVVTFAVLVLELTSTRLFAYVGNAHATATALSIALLGLGLGAALRVRAPSRVAPPRAAFGLAAALAALAAATAAGVGLAGLVALSLAPFALAGAVLADAYATRGPAAAATTYAIDLAAAAAGCVVAPRLIGPLAPTEIIAALGATAGALALALAPPRPRSRALAAATIALHLGVLAAGRAGALPDGPLAALLRADRDDGKAIVLAGRAPREVVDSAWSPLGRLDVHRVAHDPTRLGVYTDGMSPTYLIREAEARAGAFADDWGLLMALPYRALAPRRVLILGAGAGASAWLARHAGATTVDAVEVNPAIPDLLARWRGFAGDVYREPGVHLVVADARRYLTDTDARYDLVELALALTGNGHDQPAGLEAHLYTVEAVELYLARLAPTGALVLVHSDPGNAYRQLRTVIDALVARGVPRERALDRIAVLRDPRPTTAYHYAIVASPSPLSLDVVDRLDADPAALLWGPGDPPARAAELLDPTRLGATARDDLSPVHDDRPYFFQNTDGLVATALAQPGRLWVLVGALVLIAVLVLERRLDGPSPIRPALTAAAVGAGFATVELALIQRFTLAVGGTLYAVSFVLGALLAWSAVGALVRARWARVRTGAAACGVAALAIAATAILVRELAWLDAIADDTARLALVAALLAPVGLAIGGPFPALLARHGDRDDRVARLWATNGAGAVAGGVVAVLALRVGGIGHALAIAAALYALAAIGAKERAR